MILYLSSLDGFPFIYHTKVIHWPRGLLVYMDLAYVYILARKLRSSLFSLLGLHLFLILITSSFQERGGLPVVTTNCTVTDK